MQRGIANDIGGLVQVGYGQWFSAVGRGWHAGKVLACFVRQDSCHDTVPGLGTCCGNPLCKPVELYSVSGRDCLERQKPRTPELAIAQDRLSRCREEEGDTRIEFNGSHAGFTADPGYVVYRCNY